MRNRITKIFKGLKKSKITIIEPNFDSYLEKSGKKRYKSKVRCDCGNEFELNNNYLLRQKDIMCKDCHYNQNCIVSIGATFDKLKVIGFDNSADKRKRKRCVCLCVCGNKITIRPGSLKSNKQNNCGCILRHGTYVGKLSKDAFNKIKNNAKNRSISFEVDMQYLWNLYEKQNGICALSGLNIEFSMRVKDKRTASIDRIDSNKGYIEGNLQWIHKDINRMKCNFDQIKFIKLCKLISNYNKN